MLDSCVNTKVSTNSLERKEIVLTHFNIEKEIALIHFTLEKEIVIK